MQASGPAAPDFRSRASGRGRRRYSVCPPRCTRAQGSVRTSSAHCMSPRQVGPIRTALAAPLDPANSGDGHVPDLEVGRLGALIEHEDCEDAGRRIVWRQNRMFGALAPGIEGNGYPNLLLEFGDPPSETMPANQSKSSVKGARPARQTTPVTRPAMSAAHASACGAPPDAPITANRGTPMRRPAAPHGLPLTQRLYQGKGSSLHSWGGHRTAV